MADITKQPVHRDTARADGNYSTGDISAVPVTKTADYNITAEDYYLFADSSGGSFSFYLPPAADVPSVVFIIKKIVSSNLVTIIPDGAETIEGNSSAVLSVQYDYISIMSDGTNWVVGGEIPTLAQVLAVGSNGGGATITNAIWHGSVVELAYGGTNANLTAVNGGVVYSTAAAMAITAAGSAGQMFRSAGAAAPAWSTATYPDTITANQVLYATGTNAIGSSADLTYNGSGLLTLRKDQNASSYLLVWNNTSGTAAQAFVYVNSPTVQSYFSATSALYTPSGLYTASSAVLICSQGTQFNIGNSHSAPLYFWTNNTQRLALAADGTTFTMGVGGVGTINHGIVVNGGTTGLAYFGFQQNTSTKGIIGLANSASALINNSVNTDLCIRNSQRILFSADGGATANGAILAAGQWIFGAAALVSTEFMLVRKDQNAATGLYLYNATGGSASQTYFRAGGDTCDIYMATQNSSFTTSGLRVADQGYILTSAASAGLLIGNLNAAPIQFCANGTAAADLSLHISSVNNISIGGSATRGTTVGTKALQIFDGTAPAGTLANGVSLYSGSGKLKSADAAGTIGHVLSVSAVNNVSPTAQNRTLTVDIGGTTYYITAKTTND